jgi:AcrR family transcriptional regulator
MSPASLPVLGQPPAERADAARNRRKILAIAEDIVRRRGVAELSMNEVAAAAGVGVGTVYRRFGDRAALIDAMMDEREHTLQEGFLTGPPPLGPGAPPLDRIRAFLGAYLDLLDAYAPLMAVAETTMPVGRRYAGGAYAVHHTHLRTLIRDAHPGTDADCLAHALLATVSPTLFLHQRHEGGLSLERIRAGLDQLLTCVTPNAD